MRVLVLGIGNVMFADEGVGVHFVKMIEGNYKFSGANELKFIDGGTLALALTPIIAEFDHLIVVDCISADDAKVGDVFFFDFENVPNFVHWDGSAHEIEMLQTLHLMDMAGDRPSCKILGIVPKRVEPIGFELSNEIINGTKIAEDTLLNYLGSIGFYHEKVAEFSLQEIADRYATKGLK
ncbi:HyaD/HybD family hydrogenase maturation endopeptidase [Campylobacter curvus]|uniref:[NiFe] hydrogenase maturation protease HydD n=1 Tax=Campylobacter curvus (strain 525.92) TaxID=360105 RepID=A7GYK1_CAMC5|nr:HyaD/HybD family hydrogenase maturation endopeptidase [Campylobacter curvus]EAU00086.1 [NiFe] hydrogenase maturation protease HydD [Campylobacter curvus 525.92]